jgi:CDP-diacylglycerol--glycerol-3-phosphate 3-phosphatidyltransferase
MNKLPIALIYLRLAIGFLIVFLSYIKIDDYSVVAIALLTVGLLTDIFDGIIARHLNISNQRLRRLDSTIDQLFFISFTIATFLHSPTFFEINHVKLIILIGTEAIAYLICFLKFHKEIATHSIGAKIWTLLLFATLIQITWQLESNFLFSLCFWVGLITRFEIIAIIITLNVWTNDVPTIYHALLLRKGKQIKRHKMFNG